MEILHHTIEHTLPMIPVLFVTYLVLETIERKHWNPKFLTNSGLAPIGASALGLIPQCGLPAMFANFYAAGLITTGTLVASFLSCSDEMLPLLISSHVPLSDIFKILSIKFASGAFFGMLLHMKSKRRKSDIEALCHKENCGCESSIFSSALTHTIHITWTVFLVTLVLELVLHDASFLSDVLKNAHWFIKLCASTLIGLVPNCASSVLLTQLYLSELLPFASLIAGLCANAGFGMLVLFRVNPQKKDTLRILGILVVCAFVTGLILSLF